MQEMTIQEWAQIGARHVIDVVMPLYERDLKYLMCLDEGTKQAYSIFPLMEEWVECCSKGFYVTRIQESQLILWKMDGTITGSTYKQLYKDLWNFGKNAWIAICKESNGDLDADETVLDDEWADLYWSLLKGK